MRKAFWVASIGLVAMCMWLTVHHVSPVHRLTLRAYYHQGRDVRKGTLVAVDGVGCRNCRQRNCETRTRRPPCGSRLETEYTLPTGDSPRFNCPGCIARSSRADRGRHRHAYCPWFTYCKRGSIDGRESTDAQVSHALGVIVKAAVDEAKEGQTQEKSAAHPAKYSSKS